MGRRPAETKLLALYNHIETDPDARGYSAMTVVQQAADLVTTDTIDVEKDGFQTLELWSAVHMPEFVTLIEGTNSNQSKALAVIGFVCTDATIPQVSIPNTRLFFQRMFGAGSDTRTAIDTLLATGTVSRATLLGYGNDDAVQMQSRIETANNKFGS